MDVPYQRFSDCLPQTELTSSFFDFRLTRKNYDAIMYSHILSFARRRFTVWAMSIFNAFYFGVYFCNSLP